MKRNIAISLHLIGVLAIAWALAMLHSYALEGTGLEWTRESSFEDSQIFSDLVSTDLASLREYAVLRDAFTDEEDGEVDMSRTVVIASTSNGIMGYKLSDLVAQAARYGYTMDSSTHLISAGEAGTDEEPYELTVTYKFYDPYYFDRIEVGPTQGLTNIRELGIECLRALAQYYSLDSVYSTGMSNLQYRIYFVADDGSEILLDNTSYTSDELKRLGRYLIVDEQGSVETDISPLPAGILDRGTGYELSFSDGNAVELGIDTSYLFNDRYLEARERYASDIEKVRNRLYALVAAILVAALSLVPTVRGEREETAIDRIPLEALVLVMALFSMALYLVFRWSAYHILTEIIATGELEFWRETVKGIIVWLVSVMILSSLYRRSLHGGVLRHSLAHGFLEAVSHEEAGRAAWNALKSYGAFLFIEGALAVFCVVMWERRGAHPIYIIAMWIGLALFVAFIIWVYAGRVRAEREKDELRRVTGLIASGQVGLRLDESEFDHALLDISRNINNISDGLKLAVDEQVKADKLKADLITNVSHDIRTPLTSIINYVDLIKREEPDDPVIAGYVDILEQKSARLKNLTDDLIEASKASSGNITLDMERIDMRELAEQAGGELRDKFSARGLTLELDAGEEPGYILADGRYLYRVLENLYNNAAKYSMEGTRVYAQVRRADGQYIFTIKNVSAERLNISPDELTERFVRGDSSRNTEGSGLGLSIAKSLTSLMGGNLVIEIDGDLYKASVIMREYAD